MQKMDANVSALLASNSKLQQEKNQLQKEKAELLAKLAAVKGAALFVVVGLRASCSVA